ncbi:MAG: CHAT domain-containing protein [Bacteroidota bacterium]
MKASLLNESKSDYVPTTCNDAVPRADFEVFLDRTFTQDTFDDSAKENNDSAILLKQFEKEQLTKEAILSDVPRALDFDSEDEISILFLAANPSSSSRISWEKEQTAVAERIDSTKCKTTPVSGITLDDLIDAVEDHEPNIIHFVGHGTAVEIDKEGNPTKAGLLLHHNRAGKEIIETATLKRQFAAFKDDNPALQLVFLNACHSSEQAKAISEVGLITVGTSDEIISEVAQKFAVGFYRWLSKHPAVDVLVAMKKGMNRAASSSEPIKELIHIYSNGVKIYPS